MKLRVILASPRGFCAGVVRAIETVRKSIATHGPPIYVLHEIVHNRHVLEELEELGAVFVKKLTDIPAGGLCIFSAHGVSTAVEKRAAALGLNTVDATCPLVSSVHRMVERCHSQGYDVVIIGHHKHPEVEGTAGRAAGRVHVVANEEEAASLQVADDKKVAYVTQTTLSQDDICGIKQVLKRRFPAIAGKKSNICFATQNRQDAVRHLAAECDLVFVVGSKNSSNSNRLREAAARKGCAAYLIDDYRDIDLSCLNNRHTIGITAGASAPERLVAGVLSHLHQYYDIAVEEMAGKKEQVFFRPAELKL
ncbi:MAG: 4-hydroxy-3-methylbut-2-enyl diphosphate reductase [Deltaproteobacteria bacterium]|nr:MAG: 4-hydroxy-3-methylbut-2-enyl diphosphate reductase [Deltaproteobacteria bacterium]